MTPELRQEISHLVERLRAIPTPPTQADNAADAELIRQLEEQVARFEGSSS